MATTPSTLRRSCTSVLGFTAGLALSAGILTLSAPLLAAPRTGTLTLAVTPSVAAADAALVSGIVTVSGTASPDVDVAGIQFQINSVNLGAEITTGACGIGWDTTGAADGTYLVSALARDAAWSTLTAAPLTVVVENALPALSAVRADPVTRTDATLTWTTSQPATSQVYFGRTLTYDLATIQDIALGLTHRQVLTDLAPSTTYHFRVESQNAVGASVTSVDGTFTTGLTAAETPTLHWAAPAAVSAGTPLSDVQLNATADRPGTFVYTPAAGTVLDAGAQALGVTFTPADLTTATVVTATVTLTVTPAPAVTPVLSWAPPASLTRGTPLSAAQLNATANVPGTFAYSPAAGTVLDTGDQLLTVFFTPAGLAAAPAISATVRVSVVRALPTVTWASPAPVVDGTALGAAQLTATASVPGSFTYLAPAGTIVHTGSVTLLVIFTPTDMANFGSVIGRTTLTVTAAAAVTPVLSWAPPASLTRGTPLGAAQLNATANVPGTFTYSPAAGTILDTGDQLLTVFFTPAGISAAPAISATVRVSVVRALPTVTWASPAPVVDGTALSAAQLNATASVNGSFTYLAPAGTIVHTGTVTLLVIFTPTDMANFGSVVGRTTLTVLPNGQ